MISHLLDRSLAILGDRLPFARAEYQRWYRGAGRSCWNVEKGSAGLTYCVFSYPEHLEQDGRPSLSEPSPLERIILLAYDEKEQIVADCAGLHGRLPDILSSQPVYDFLSTESDWLYLEHRTLAESFFPELPYPLCKSAQPLPESGRQGEVLLLTNAYVSKAWRQKGIFTCLLAMMREHALRDVSGTVCLYTAIALDPDIAEYGPDAVPGPYRYKYEVDEPVRQRNRMILEHLQFTVLCYEEDPDPQADGTKRWFAVRRELDVIKEDKEPS